MQTLTEILDSIPTNSCPNREEAKRDLSSGISMNSRVVIENFINTWLLTSESDLVKMSQEDKAYRQFIVEFNEVYSGRD